MVVSDYFFHIKNGMLVIWLKYYLDGFLPVQTIDELVRVVQFLEEFFNLLFLGTLVESINMHMSLPFLIESLAVLAGNLKKFNIF